MFGVGALATPVLMAEAGSIGLFSVIFVLFLNSVKGAVNMVRLNLAFFSNGYFCLNLFELNLNSTY